MEKGNEKGKERDFKYIKKGKIIPLIKQAHNRGQLMDLLQNIDNEVEYLISRNNPKAWSRGR